MRISLLVSNTHTHTHNQQQQPLQKERERTRSVFIWNFVSFENKQNYLENQDNEINFFIASIINLPTNRQKKERARESHVPAVLMVVV